MWLKEWLFKNEITVTDCASKLGISREQLSGIISGRVNASPKTAMKIEKFTNGKVTAHEILFGEKRIKKKAP